MTNDKDALRVRLINIICGDVLPTYNHVTKADMVITAVEEPLRARIAELEAALNGLMVYGCPACNGDCSAANPPVIGCPMEAARAAYLGEKE
jgi:hypothetical protein